MKNSNPNNSNGINDFKKYMSAKFALSSRSVDVKSCKCDN